MQNKLSLRPIYTEGISLYGSYQHQRKSWHHYWGETRDMRIWSSYQAVTETIFSGSSAPEADSWVFITRFGRLWRWSILLDDGKKVSDLNLCPHIFQHRFLNENLTVPAWCFSTFLTLSLLVLIFFCSEVSQIDLKCIEMMLHWDGTELQSRINSTLKFQCRPTLHYSIQISERTRDCFICCRLPFTKLITFCTRQ